MNPNRQATEPASWVCTPCAKAAGGSMPDGHMATFHEGTCCVCKKQAVVTEPRDYRWVNGPPDGADRRGRSLAHVGHGLPRGHR